MNEVTLSPLGIIHTPFQRHEDAPAQGCFLPDSRGYVEIFPEYAPGLQDITGFSHLILIYCFHKTSGYELVTKPLLDKEKKGIFATRYFKRPNSIGLSVVRLMGVVGARLDIAEVDMLDGTPLLDIKPYVSRFDIREGACDGWFARASEWKKYEEGSKPSAAGSRQPESEKGKAVGE
jgi:tRNA-Thr(GGU) m(6)t(6)A37 methyltransferase TsaA